MEKRVLYFDCFSGISGDMTVGALLDLGADKELLLKGLASLPIKGYRIEIKKTEKNGISGTDFNVIVENAAGQPHRHLKDIIEIIDRSSLNENIKKISGDIFRLIAEAESRVHGVSVDEIHFHEVGAVDSIVDIVGTAICVDLLKCDTTLSSPLNLGSGFVNCAHGKLPVPAPATIEILKDVPVYSSGVKKELTTPTGAAIIKSICSGFEDFPAMIIEKTGYGLGKTALETPNVLRAVIGTRKDTKKLVVLETNIDNMNPEILTYLYPKLFEKGALDVYTSPILMKKNRLASQISVLCPTEKVEPIEDLLFRETPTLGIRKYAVERDEMDRRSYPVETPFGSVSVKAAYLKGELVKFSPEYEDCAQLAEKTGKPLQEIYSIAMECAGEKLGKQ